MPEVKARRRLCHRRQLVSRSLCPQTEQAGQAEGEGQLQASTRGWRGEGGGCVSGSTELIWGRQAGQAEREWRKRAVLDPYSRRADACTDTRQ